MNLSRRQLLAAAAAAAPWAALRGWGLGRVPQNAPPAGPRFVDVTARSGIHYRHSFGETRLSSILEGTGAGCAWLDYNNDGWLDLYVVNGRYLPGVTNRSAPDGRDATNHLYRNNGDGTFTDVTQEARVAGRGFALGVTVGDFDNDGWPDIFVTGYLQSVLYHNNGDGTFTDVTVDAGVTNPHYATAAAFLDYDRDGRLDLFIGNYLDFLPNYREYYKGRDYPGPLDYAPQFNRLLHNNGDGTFSDVSRESGIARVAGRAMGVTVGDYDNDGWPDIFVANDSMESFLYRNNHDGTFTNVALEQNVAFGQNGEATTAMGPVFADCHNQGWLDLFVSDGTYQRYYRNGRAAHRAYFLDRTAQSGIGRACGQYVGWGDGVFDYDNDGWKDIFIGDGGLAWMIPMKSVLLRNDRRGGFDRVGHGGFFAQRHVCRGACFGDYDNDGYVDAFLTTLGGPGILLRNTPTAGARRHWLTIRLEGTRSNRDGYGTRLVAETGGLRQMVEAVSACGYLSQNDPRPHFGLGHHKQVDRLTLHWPSGTVQVLRGVPADQILHVKEPAPAAAHGKGSAQ